MHFLSPNYLPLHLQPKFSFIIHCAHVVVAAVLLCLLALQRRRACAPAAPLRARPPLLHPRLDVAVTADAVVVAVASVGVRLACRRSQRNTFRLHKNTTFVCLDAFRDVWSVDLVI